MSRGAVGAVAAGGAVGALARSGLTGVLPVPWGTLVVNVVGCALIGVLMVLVSPSRRLLRPFLGAGVLGGFTTFSAYAVEGRELLVVGSVPLALAYVAGTVLGCLLATAVAAALTRRVVGR